MADEQTSADATARFYRLVWPERAALLRLAYLLTRDHGEAEELAQDTLIKAFKAIDRFEEGTDVRAWLSAILRNARVDRLRAAGASQLLRLDELPYEPAQTDVATEAQWRNPQDILNGFSDEQVIAALAAVPEEIRWALLLVDVEGIGQVEAGSVLGVPVGTIKSRLHRGRALLREALLPMAKDRRVVRE